MTWDRKHPLIYMQDALQFRISDMDVDNDPRYYGYLEKDGKWMIIKETVAAPRTYRYIFGEDDYVTNWGNRAMLGYNYFNEVF